MKRDDLMSPLTYIISLLKKFTLYNFGLPIAQVNSGFLTLIDSADAKTKMVECSRGSIGAARSFKCEFCYSVSRSCQSSMTCADVIPGSGFTTFLPQSLAEGTYCYHATAIVDGGPAKMIQDTFSIHSCSNTGMAKGHRNAGGWSVRQKGGPLH